MSEATIHLTQGIFGEREKALAEAGQLSASAFRYPSGVCALRLKNDRGEIVMLPFQGQQIWSAQFAGRELTMRSMFDMPRATSQYLETYGAFLVHCGALAMGVPTRDDSHALHGELPNAIYQQAQLVIGQDRKGDYIGVGGAYQHTVAFNANYFARPLVKLYAGATLLDLSMTISNLKNSEMDLMYLAHINYRPVDNGRLVYSAPCVPEHARVRRSIPSHAHPKPGYREFLDELQKHPEKHNLLAPGLAFDPEVVFTLDYLADKEGWAHTMQVLPDGSADYVRHRPSQLDKGVRWICRTADQDALGLVLPATAEPEGYSAEKAKGNLRHIAAHGEFRVDIEMGALTAAEASKVEKQIGKILKS